MISPYQFWIDLGQLLLRPKQLLFGIFDLFFSWVFTRNWWALLFGIPAGLIFAVMIGSSLYIGWIGPKELLSRYWKTIEKENVTSALMRAERLQEMAGKSTGLLEGSADEGLVGKEELTPFASSLLMKIIQLEISDTRATYLVAAALANQGRRAQARHLMRRIAAENERGFAPAHAWLAADRMQFLKISDRGELTTLMSDLAEASRWPGVEPMLMNAYADLLVRENKIDQAVSLLQAAGKRNPRLLLKLAGIAKQQGNQILFENLREELEGPRKERLQNGQATESDYIELLSLQILNQESEQAIEIAQAGLRLYPENAQLKRLQSTAFMMIFEKTPDQDSDPGKRLDILDKAMKSDPGNPAVQEKIAELISAGKVSDERFTTFLREQLAAGKATAITHLLLAIGHLRKNELEKAIVHLELAYGLAPRNPVILNNLALCIARTRPNQLPQARQMMEVALSIAGANAELLDSYGEILLLSKDLVGAVRAFEAVLSINQDRPATRKKLADAYVQLNLDEMAETVRKGGNPKPAREVPVGN